jgi:carbon-monoxide dehydrogenase catalytic subunit
MLETKSPGLGSGRDIRRPWPEAARFEAHTAAPLRLAKAIRIGLVRGVVSLAGRHGPLLGLVRELIRQDMFVVVTGEVGDLAETGLLGGSGRDEAGVGLAEFCTHCDIPPVWHLTGDEGEAPLAAFCQRLATALGAAETALPVVAWEAGREPQARPGARGQAEAIGRHITAKRLALGLNDRFDGSVYS